MSRNERLLAVVSAMKRGEYPSAPQLAEELRRRSAQRGSSCNVCAKTIQRDITYLRCELDAPIFYDERRHGYYLSPEDWVFPSGHLHSDQLFAALFSESLARNLVPGALGESLGSALRVQLAAAEPESIDPDLLNSVVFATGSRVDVDPEVFDAVSRGWRDLRRLEVSYLRPGADAPTRRRVDVHALFLADGAWYARVYCHLRRAVRNLALHRLRSATLAEDTFVRSPAVADELQAGNVFHYATARGVVVRCDREKAGIIEEREWFPQQEIRRNPDGTVDVTCPSVPKPDLVRWVLSYGGHLRVLAPPELRDEVRDAAERLLRAHTVEG